MSSMPPVAGDTAWRSCRSGAESRAENLVPSLEGTGGSAEPLALAPTASAHPSRSAPHDRIRRSTGRLHAAHPGPVLAGPERIPPEAGIRLRARIHGAGLSARVLRVYRVHRSSLHSAPPVLLLECRITLLISCGRRVRRNSPRPWAGRPPATRRSSWGGISPSG